MALLDNNGQPIAAEEPVEVTLATTMGSVVSPMSIPAGQSNGRTSLTAGFEIASFRLTAESKGLKGDGLTLNYVEKRRYCMHCGAKMSIDDNVCPECSLSPPSGVDVKQCINCGEVIPSVAKFCRECGAAQREEQQ